MLKKWDASLPLYSDQRHKEFKDVAVGGRGQRDVRGERDWSESPPGATVVDADRSFQDFCAFPRPP